MVGGPGPGGSPERAFYAADPSDHLRERLSLLAVRAGAPAALADLVAGGVAWGPIRLEGTATDAPDAEEAHRTAAFVVTESGALLRQASTALLVHFVAHSGPEAPWEAAPRLVETGDWLARLSEIGAAPPAAELLDHVAEVFLGGVRAEPSQAWLVARDSSARLLRVVAQRSVARTPTSVAHQLALTGVPDPSAPEAVADAHDRAWLTHLAINQLRVLWKVARRRHLGEAHDGLDLVTSAALDALRG